MSRRMCTTVLLLLLGACGINLDAVEHPPQQTSVLLRDGAVQKECVLEAGSVEIAALDDWLARNTGGWGRYYATPTMNGVFVSTRLGYLQFTESSVIAHRREGLFIKDAAADMYELLAESVGP